MNLLLKFKKPRVKPETVIPVPIVDEPEEVKPYEIDITQPIEVSYGVNVEP